MSMLETKQSGKQQKNGALIEVMSLESSQRKNSVLSNAKKDRQTTKTKEGYGY